MICTENEAAEKFCPHVRQGVKNIDGSALASVNFIEERFSTCIGSQCMMWRWYDIANNPKESKGFCGLAHGKK